MYHYALGSIVKVSKHFIHDETRTMYLLRLINILLVVIGLLMLRKLFRELNVDRVYQNITFALMTLTTMFIGISAAVNYDNAVFLLASLFLLELFRFIKRYSAVDFMWLIVIGALGLLVKFAFSVILVAGVLVILARFITDKKMLTALTHSFRKVFAKQRLTSACLVVLVVLSLGLVGERYGENIVKYHAISPACTRLHTEQECKKNLIYTRDASQKIAFDKFIKNGGKVIYSPLGFTGEWLTQMYNSVFFYLGQLFVISSGQRLQNTAAVFMVIALSIIVVYYRRHSVLTSPEDRNLAFITGFYILVLFLLNLNSYLHTASFYGFQGRYLLPIMPFVFLFFVRAFGSACQTLAKKGHQFVLYGLIIYALVLGYLQMPVLVFYRGTNQAWFSEPTKRLNLKIQNGLTTLKIAQKGSLPSSINGIPQ